MAAEDTRHGFTPALVVLLTLLGNILQYTNMLNKHYIEFYCAGTTFLFGTIGLVKSSHYKV